ncbi:hypothetical protein [Pseudomonas putida]|uniref:hypothetical protein n=1 Tax=Pseudomonas putida TaxID=303 RepID=UPI002022F123|nr:hypothetical protein [Pseudomonas putida]MCL8304568.1 hypothetical protein [Pseudomonas putida]
MSQLQQGDNLNQEVQAPERFPYRELVERMTSFSPTGGCKVVLLPAGTPIEQCQKMAAALKHVMSIPPLVICGDLELVDEAAMNAAGWYRK